MNLALLLVGLLVAAPLVLPFADAHVIVGYPHPRDGRCTGIVVGSAGSGPHGAFSVVPCRAVHATSGQPATLP